MRVWLALVFMIALSFCPLVAADVRAAGYRSHHAGPVLITVPADWIIQPQPGAVLALRSPVQAGAGTDETALAARERARAAVAVVVTSVVAGTTLDAFADQCRADLKRFATGLELQADATTERGGLTWRRLRYRFVIGPYSFVQDQYLAVVDGSGVCVAVGCGAEAAERWSTAFAAVGAGLRRTER
jgi:hypothetical protein